MRTISSNIAKQTFGSVLKVVQREPVMIEKHNHPTAVVLSVAEYDRLKLGKAGPEHRAEETLHRQGPISKSLPVLPRKLGRNNRQLSPQEMVDLVKAAETDSDA